MIQSFFNASKYKDTSGNKSGRPLSCASCGMYRDVLSPKIKPYGDFEKEIMMIGLGPGETEDRKGKSWQGRAGNLLRDSFVGLGINLFRDAISLNAVNCRPVDEDGNNRMPTDYEIACCRKYVLKAIEQYKPKLIILAGGEAVKSIIGHRWKKDLGGISKWVGWAIPDRDFGCWICPVFHPSYIMRMEKSIPAIKTIFLQDLQNALAHLKQPVPHYKDEKGLVQIVQVEDQLSSILDSLNAGESDLLSIDFETTGLKPHAKGHRVVCMSITSGPDSCYAFMIPQSQALRGKIRKLFTNPNVAKTAHNVPFEETWSEVRLHTPIMPWRHCSLQAAHILNNRPGITSLKFQSYVHFGLCDYDSHVSPYLKATNSKNANAKNKIFEFIKRYGPNELLTYCGLDTLLQRRLALKQMEQMGISH